MRYLSIFRITPGDSFFDQRENIPLDPKFNHDKYYCKCDQTKAHVDCRIDAFKDPPAVLVSSRSPFLSNINILRSSVSVCFNHFNKCSYYYTIFHT